MKVSAILLICLVLAVQQLNAFCIYNHLSEDGGTFWIRQQPYNAGPNYFARFARTSLGPGEKACCSYTTYDCVKSGNKDDIIYITIRRTTGIMEYPPFVISLPAGGWINLGGGIDPAQATIDVFTPDGEPFDYEYRVDHQAGYT